MITFFKIENKELKYLFLVSLKYNPIPVEKDLIEQLKRGERKAVEFLYKDAFSYCAQIITSNNGSMDDAKDLFQEALIVLFRNLRKEDFTLSCKIKTYLYSVCRNLWLKKLNKKKTRGNEVSFEDHHKDFLVFEEVEFNFDEIEPDKFELVNKAFQSIKEDCRKLLMGYYFKKISLKDLAVTLDYTYQFIKVKKNRCMGKLKSEVQILQDS